MELAELKKELHTLINETDDKQALLEVAFLIADGKQQDYENSDEFWNAIEKARKSVAAGKGIDNKAARAFIKQLPSSK